MLKYSYAIEKLESAVRTLATHPGDARARMASAYWGFHPLRSEHLPEDCRGSYEELMARLSSAEPDGMHDAFEVALRKMKNRTAAKLAQTLYDMLIRVREAYLTELRDRGLPYPKC